MRLTISGPADVDALPDHVRMPVFRASPQRLLEEAARLAQFHSASAMLQAIEAAVAGFTDDELPRWLGQQPPRLFQLFPSSAWQKEHTEQCRAHVHLLRTQHGLLTVLRA
jgi:hypothetical protein